MKIGRSRDDRKYRRLVLVEDANVSASTRRWRFDGDAVTVVVAATSLGGRPYQVSRSWFEFSAFERSLNDGTEEVVVVKMKLQSGSC